MSAASEQTITKPKLKTKTNLISNVKETNTEVRSFKFAFAFILLIEIQGYIIQKLNPQFDHPVSFPFVITILTIAASVAGAFFFRQHLYRLLTSYHFAVSILGVLLTATIVGTFILQNAPEEAYSKVYGPSLTAWIHALYLDNLFHSLWYSLLFALMATSLVLVLIKRKPFRLTQLGFCFSHVGIVLILAGGLIGILYGERGMIDLYKGTSANAFKVTRNGMYTGETSTFPFRISLDDFSVDYYKSNYKIFAYRFKPEINNYEAIGSFEIATSPKTHKIPGSNTYFQIVAAREVGDRSTLYQKAIHTIQVAGGSKQQVQPGKLYSVEGGWQLEVLSFIPAFSYDLQLKRVVNISDEPLNPALLVRLTKNTEEYTTWLFAKIPEYSRIHNSPTGIPALFYQLELPECCESTVPQIDVEFNTPGGMRAATLTYHMGEPLYLEEGKFALIIDRREQEAKEYRSLVSIWENDRKVLQRVIRVNHPLSYGGYSFYQSNYDPKNPDYSGLQVVRDPGLWLVYAGFILLGTGVIYIFYITPRIVEFRRKRQEAVNYAT